MRGGLQGKLETTPGATGAPWLIAVDWSRDNSRTIADKSPNPEELYAEAEDPTTPVVRTMRDLSPAELESLYARIPTLEADIIERLRAGCHQREIAEIFGMSQAGISYRAYRGLERFRWLMTYGSYFTEREVWTELFPLFSEFQLELLGTLWRTTSQSASEQMLGIKQTKLCHNFSICLGVLEGAAKADPTYKRFYEGFNALRANWGILHEPSTQWTRARIRGTKPEVRPSAAFARRYQLLRAIRASHPEPVHWTELQRRCPEDAERINGSSVGRLLKLGYLTRTSRGYYALAPEVTWDEDNIPHLPFSPSQRYKSSLKKNQHTRAPKRQTGKRPLYVPPEDPESFHPGSK